MSLFSTLAYSQIYMDSPGGESIPPPPGSGGGPITPGAPASNVDMYLFLLLGFGVLLIVFITKYNLRYARTRK